MDSKNCATRVKPNILAQINLAELQQTCNAIMQPGKGILAADEKTSTIESRFKPNGIENTRENRVAYRNLLFTTPELNKYVSGVIMYDETLFDNSPNGTPFAKMLLDQGIVLGIKVDMGLSAIPLDGVEKSKQTMGFDTLNENLQRYYKQGARFAKWRATVEINCKNGLPSSLAIHETAYSLAKYAATCQRNNIVPIIEPEVLQDGDFDIETCYRITHDVIAETIYWCHKFNLYMPGALFKPNMILPGSDCKNRADSAKIGQLSLGVYQDCLPSSFGGVVLLSGGQSEEDASLNLNAINAIRNGEMATYNRQYTSFRISFSYGRALQKTCLSVWKGDSKNVAAAQEAFTARLKANSEAQLGTYTGWAGTGEAARANQHVTGYTY